MNLFSMVGDVNFPRTRLLCDGCPPLGWVGWISNTRTRLNENFGTPRCHVFKYKDWIGFQINESFKKFGILDSTTSVLVVIVTQENANEKVCISFIPGIYIC